MKNLIKETSFGDMMLSNIMSLAPISANKSYEETEAHSAFIINANSIGYTFGEDDRPERLIKSFFAATAAFLSKVKVAKVDEAAALILTDVAGNFKFAAIVEYHENDKEDEPGNWSFVMTFYDDDIKDLEKKKVVKKYLYSGGDNGFGGVFDKVAYDVGAIEFQHTSFMFDACNLVIDTLVQILDREAVAGSVVDIEMPGYFVASVSFEDEEKILAITPDGHLKSIVKDDSVLEK